jgi:hypothetical protein
VTEAPGEPHDDLLRPLYEAERAVVPAGTTWFDAHTHIGHDDPDGFEADPEELVAGLDRAGHDRALVFPMHEPAGYPPANDRAIAAAAASGGRLVALARLDPNARGVLAEARRCLADGAVGFKLHPRSDAFGLPHPVVEEVVALAAEHRAPVLFHAGRGIPRLGDAVLGLARSHPGARLILAHAGVSDLGWIAPAAAALDNLFFDTAWWQAGDLLTLFATVPPGRILYASDMPYGTGVFNGFAFLRCARAVGLGPDAIAAMAGASLERVVAGEGPIDAGPAPGADRLGPRDLGFERVVAYLGIAAQMGWHGGDPAESLALARLACTRQDGHPVAAAIDALLAEAQEAAIAAPLAQGPILFAALAGQVLAATAATGM